MGKLSSALAVFFVVFATTMVHSTFGQSKEVDQWFQKLGHAKKKVTRLHFYFHDTISGPNQSAVTVAQSPTTKTSPTRFGEVKIIDDPLTAEPEPTSNQVGRAQGLYASTGLEDLSLLMSINLVFTSGKFSQSSLTVIGQNPALHSTRELPIVGGTGVFRLARGFATLNTRMINDITATIEYNVVVVHY